MKTRNILSPSERRKIIKEKVSRWTKADDEAFNSIVRVCAEEFGFDYTNGVVDFSKNPDSFDEMLRLAGTNRKEIMTKRHAR